jgi:hypothetical protein
MVLKVGEAVAIDRETELSRREFLRHANNYLRDSVAGAGVDYGDFLAILTDERYNVSPIIEYDSSYRPDKVNVLLRHDMCYDNGYGMLELDYNHGFRSTSYLRLHADIYYKIGEVTKFFQTLEKYGFEVGYHYEVIDFTMKGSEVDFSAAEKLFADELSLLRQSFNIRSVTPHGGFSDAPSENFEFEADGSRLQKHDVFSAYNVPFSRPVNFYYLTDTSTEFVTTGLDYFKEGLAKAKAGEVVETLLHPLIGRWNYKYYPNDVYPVLTPRTFQIPTASVVSTATSTGNPAIPTSVPTLTSTSSSTTELASLPSQIGAPSDSLLHIALEYLANSRLGLAIPSCPYDALRVGCAGFLQNPSKEARETIFTNCL